MFVLGFMGISEFIGEILYTLYQKLSFTGNGYGFSIILITIMVRLILFPLNVKAIKSNLTMQELGPDMKKIQEKYKGKSDKDSKERMNKELMEFYKEKKFNPAGGCLPMLLQMPLLILLYRVFSMPLTNILGIGQDTVSKIGQFIFGKTISFSETGIIENISKELADKMVFNDIMTGSIRDKILDMQSGMHFFGINLTITPSYHTANLFGPNSKAYWLALIIPVVSVVTMFISSKMAMATTNTDDNPQAQMAKKMIWLGPIMTLMFSFQFPGALGFYWAVGNCIQILQQFYVNKYIKKNPAKLSKEVA